MVAFKTSIFQEGSGTKKGSIDHVSLTASLQFNGNAVVFVKLLLLGYY